MKKDKKQKTLQRIMEYMKPYRFLIFASLVLAVISVALTLYVPILTGQGVDCIISKGNVDFDDSIEYISIEEIDFPVVSEKFKSVNSLVFWYGDK